MSSFIPPNTFRNRIRTLPKAGFRGSAKLLLSIELTFALMEFLDFTDEPITAGYALLSGTSLYEARLRQLNDAQRRAVANIRQIVPYSSRFAWEDALRQYMRIHEQWRNYNFDPKDLENQILDTLKCEPMPQPAHFDIYDDCLTAHLQQREQAPQYPKERQSYIFHARRLPDKMSRTASVQFDATYLKDMDPHQADWLNTPRSRTVLSIEISELETVANFLDQRERELKARNGIGSPHWHENWEKIRFCKTFTVEGKTDLHEPNTLPLDLQGIVHLPGMVASRKTTLAKLIAAYTVLNRDKFDYRITLVLGDVNSCLRVANEINRWFCDDPETDQPVAVPLLGRSTRETHMERFYSSAEYLAYRKHGVIHWGERWLNPVCPIQAISNWQDGNTTDSIVPGSEPCSNLMLPSISSRRTNRRIKASRHQCPLFSHCPTQQLYHDMKNANIWITTPAGMMQSNVPRQLDQYVRKLGDIVYLQSDLVIFDEVETVMEWCEHAFAPVTTLTDGQHGLLDILDPSVTQYLTRHRVLEPATARWTGAERGAAESTTAILTLLSETAGQPSIHKWVARRNFTPNTLFYRFVRRLAGFKETDSTKLHPDKRRRNEERTRKIFRYFDLLRQGDPLKTRFKARRVARLAAIMQKISNTLESADDEDIFQECKDWITEFYPATEKRLTALRERLGKSKNRYDREYEVDTLTTLAYRLQFALSVATLDRHMQIVLYEVDNKPTDIVGDLSNQRIARGLTNILPLPLTGRQFGFAYNEQAGSGDTPNRYKLLLFSYTNIGRSYLLNFNRLYSDLDGLPGPHILALSGTSYLPHSTRLHLDIAPAGVLLPDADTEAVIGGGIAPTLQREVDGSTFRFLPQYRDGKPIFVSGAPYKRKPITNLMMALVTDGHEGVLGAELRELERLGDEDPAQWADRARLLLLVNSYEQAIVAADVLRQCWPQLRDQIYHLDRGDGNDDTLSSVLYRSDIEQFAHRDGKVLIAPMQSIGRGFNILNKAGKAAFGSVYFLTRPMPQPFDVQAIAQELNCRTLQWASDPEFYEPYDGLYGKAKAARQMAEGYWRWMEKREGYWSLRYSSKYKADPRRDLAATTAGLIIQAVGRLLRGGVPFHAYFVDAAWASQTARSEGANPDSISTSLLAAIIDLLSDYVEQDAVSHQLYQCLTNALVAIEGFDTSRIGRADHEKKH